jgi:ActR/RegA family two-component response regulator
VIPSGFHNGTLDGSGTRLDDIQSGVSDSSPSSVSSPTRQRVLIVDPTLSGRRLGEDLAPVCEVWLADRFEEAVAVLTTRPCTAIVTEFALGDRTGFDLLDWVRLHSPETRVVVATVFASIDSAQAAVQRGAVEVLTKPISGADVRSALGLPPPGQQGDLSPTMSIDDACMAYVSEIFDRCGSLARTAQLLGIDRRSLRRMLGRIASGRQPSRDR